jgi:hypothetical protein
MLQQGSHTKKIKTENPSDVFQCDHLDKSVAAGSMGNLPFILKSKEGKRSVMAQEIAPALTDNEVRERLPAVFTETRRNEKSSQGFPLEALSPIINWLCSFKERIIMCNQFLCGTQN